MKQNILHNIDTRQIQVGVIGLGYVGLPLAVEKAKAGFRTIGIDVQPEKVNMVNRGENYIGDIVAAELSELVAAGMLSATSDFSIVRDMDFIAICVPTPLDSYQQPDISYVKSCVEDVARHLKKGAMVVLESTTYPGTTEELIKPLLEEGSGMVCGEDFYLGFSPERVDPGNLIYNVKNTPKVVGAIGDDAREVIAAMYRAVLDGDVFEASSPKVAEMEKILENTFRNVNIALANEMAMLCDKMGINVWEVIDAAKTKPYGFTPFYPGPGPGGHCIPLDPFYLSWKAREFGFHTTLIETSAMINDRMPEYVVERAARILNRHQKPLNGSKVLVLGVAYKQDIDDYRESRAIDVIRLLTQSGVSVEYHDPYVEEYHHKGISKKSVSLSPERYDLIVVTTAHTTVDYEKIAQANVPILDTKNATKKVIKGRENIELL
ncbi:MAG: nucleotide sugar dehydrogenase [Defluviitaleaceae bacterium]|nr:nucleotide sugar dehydrogenase [Defluviitaleaceae bacterium]